MKKIASLMTATALSLALLAGCSSGSSSASPATSPAAGTEATSPAASSAPAAGDWSAATPITVVSREDGSGTRGAFIELFGVEEKLDDGTKMDNTTLDAVTVNSTSIMMTTVAGDPYAIGYISLGSLNDTVKALEIDGAAPSVETVKDGSYAIARPFNVATKDGLSEVAQDFLNFILSSEGQAVVEENGYISMDNAAAYAGQKPSGKVVVAGSSSVAPVMEKLKEAYLVVNPGAEIEIQQSDSSTGVNAAIEGIADIGMASRELKDSELEAGLTATVIATDGIAVIVNNANPGTALTSEQVKAVFVGEATSWDAVA